MCSDLDKLSLRDRALAVFHIKYRNVTLHCFYAQADQKERFVTRSLIVSISWAFSGDSKLKSREELGNFIRSVSTIPLPATSGQPIIDFEVHTYVYLSNACMFDAHK